MIGQALDRVAGWAANRQGWQRAAIAALAGAASALAMAPFYALPVLWLTVPLWIWLLDGLGARPIGAAFRVGFAFGFGYFLAGIYWIGVSLTVDPDAHAWLIPIFAVFFPGMLALFFACASALAARFWAQGPARILMFAVSLALMEGLRGVLFTGFPWNQFGYGWGGTDWGIQGASLIGVEGLTLLTILAAASPSAPAGKDRRRIKIWILPALMLALIGLHSAYGLWRIAGADMTASGGLKLRIVQPNIAQAEKYLSHKRWDHWLNLLDLTREPGLEGTTIVIWPEAAPPFVIDNDADALAMIAETLPPGAILITGAVRVVRNVPGGPIPYNSVHVIDSSGRLLDTYDKSHLVPFGEYLPLRDWLEPLGLTKIVAVPGSFGAGEGVRSLRAPGLPAFGVLICYEVLFSGAVVDRDNRPRWLVTVTDDSWFGDTTGPRQHLGIARLRAVEEGLPVVRAANTGISAIIDPYGRALQTLDYGRMGVIDATLPEPLPPTLFASGGRWAVWGLWALLAALAFFSTNRPRLQVDRTVSQE